MDKQEIIAAIMAELEKELQRQQAANEAAADGATDSEARAESKWDTQGLEASYLARGYAQQYEALVAQAEAVKRFEPQSFQGAAIGIGALVECEINAYTSLFFLFSCCGGIEVEVDGRDVTVITPDSPVGTALLKKRAGDSYSLPSGVAGKVIQVS